MFYRHLCFLLGIFLICFCLPSLLITHENRGLKYMHHPKPAKDPKQIPSSTILLGISISPSQIFPS